MSDIPAAPTPPSAAEIVRAMIAATPYARALSMSLVSITASRARLKVPYDARFVGDPETGVIAGGVITALLDHVCGASVMATLATRRAIATLDLRIDYMRGAAPGRDVFAEAHCYKVTRAVAFVRAVAFEDDPEDPVANATAAFMLADSRSAPAGANLKPPS
jgi:uncharacterized protein (TIGR00369 family)